METAEPNVENETQRPTYPWPLLTRTLLVLFAFLALGVCDAIRGPTLLDLQDLAVTDTSSISFIFMLFSIGSLTGCLGSGILLDRLAKHR